ncbi:hypothetical protein GOBAR_AA20910 [Gossypium barbadense]|uniref:Plastocyanin-like domain-containing protein n=1 Tax=Gossypium barbadense TaxID=3634 RepID=A0A2P5X8T4_GOSBA|nr:hypothetical protein GOBAR_AA20910 [Gossypium barbadense]
MPRKAFMGFMSIFSSLSISLGASSSTKIMFEEDTILLTFDNCGMWNLRSEIWDRHYLGQQLYASVISPNRSLKDEYNLPEGVLTCGIVQGMPRPPPFSS